MTVKVIFDFKWDVGAIEDLEIELHPSCVPQKNCCVGFKLEDMKFCNEEIREKIEYGGSFFLVDDISYNLNLKVVGKVSSIRIFLKKI